MNVENEDIICGIILFLIIVLPLGSVGYLIWLSAEATLGLIDSFTCDEFQEFLINQEDHSWWVRDNFVERCKNNE